MQRVDRRLFSFAVRDKEAVSALSSLCVGEFRRQAARPGGERQPNEGEGVKVGSPCVQESSFLIHQPSRALGGHTTSAYMPTSWQQASWTRGQGSYFGVSCDKLNTPIGYV